jgi:hypothetical protein
MQKGSFFRSPKFLVGVGVFVCLTGYGYFWGFQTVLGWKLRREAKKVPILNETLVPLASLAANKGNGVRLVHAGLAFEVPWQDFDRANSKFGGNMATFKFQSGRTILFFGPANNHEDLLSTLEKRASLSEDDAERLFGVDATKSNYAFHRAILRETPSRIRPFTPQREAIRSSILLIMKGITSVGGGTGLFEVQTRDWKGFQLDDPAKNPVKVTLELYDLQDEHVEIIFSPGKGESAGLTQADINRVIQSLQATNDPQTIPLANRVTSKNSQAESSSSQNN